MFPKFFYDGGIWEFITVNGKLEILGRNRAMKEMLEKAQLEAGGAQ